MVEQSISTSQHFNGQEVYNYVSGMIKEPRAKCRLDFCKGKFSFKRAKKHFNSDLSVSNKRKKITNNMLRIVEEEELDRVRCVLGSRFGVGITKDAPTLKAISELRKAGSPISDMARLQDDDEVRVVSCQPEDRDNDSKKDRPEIDSLYNKLFPQR
jgi:hypothetical protein